MSKIGRIIFAIVYAVLIGGSIYGITQVEIHFDIEFFVSEESVIYGWYQMNDKYFAVGSEATKTVIESKDLDLTDEEVQEKLHAFNVAIQDCTGCEQEWHEERSLDSWVEKYTEWASSGKCTQYTPVVNEFAPVPSSKFYPCLDEYWLTDNGKLQKKSVRYEDGKIIAW